MGFFGEYRSIIFIFDYFEFPYSLGPFSSKGWPGSKWKKILLDKKWKFTLESKNYVDGN